MTHHTMEGLHGHSASVLGQISSNSMLEVVSQVHRGSAREHASGIDQTCKNEFMGVEIRLCV